MSGVASLISKSLKSVSSMQKTEIPPVLRKNTGNLYEVLSRTPTGLVGKEVHQTRWSAKQIANSYWVVTRAVFKNEGKHGKAWGKLHWRGSSFLSSKYLRPDHLDNIQAFACLLVKKSYAVL
jgi:small subunit ribosomal protein S34